MSGLVLSSTVLDHSLNLVFTFIISNNVDENLKSYEMVLGPRGINEMRSTWWISRCDVRPLFVSSAHSDHTIPFRPSHPIEKWLEFLETDSDNFVVLIWYTM